MNYNYPSLSETMNKLKSEGYTVDFNLNGDCIHCKGEQLRVYPADFKIDKFFRFEGPSDPSDGSILYAISSTKHNLRGLLVNGYGIYSDELSNDMVARLTTSS